MQPFTVITIETPSLGNRAYVVHDGEVAFVVDPQRDLDRVLAVLDEAGVRLAHVLETHVHNDYVTGGHALAHATDATYSLNAADHVAFDHHGLTDGDVVTVGAMDVTVIATPGHTFTHLAYALSPTGADVGAAQAVFTGGSLLFGSTGRPDLLGPEHTGALVRHQHASAHRLADLLPDSASVYPTHGFGSFCSAGATTGASTSTIGDERRHNPVLQQDEEAWVSELLAGLGAWPAYYVHMAPANAAGPAAPDLSVPALADPDELRRRLAAGEWVVDLRERTAFAAGHAPGTYSFGVEGPFATYLGWLIPWGTPLTLLGTDAEQVARAQRELVRIGIDRPAAHATGGPEDWTDAPLGSFPTATFADLAEARHHRAVSVLDVRRGEEFAAGHVDDAVNVPLGELVERIGDVPAGPVWVHCAAGYRAAAAASILAAAGVDVVAVDDEFDNAATVGLVTA